MNRKTKIRIGSTLGALIVIILCCWQLPYLVDPGLRDLHIRENIAKITAEECAELVADCEKLYRDNVEKLESQSNVIVEAPPVAKKLGFKSANIYIGRRGQVAGGFVEFRAGAGGFSQVGPILVHCIIDEKSQRATGLSLGFGRSYDAETGKLKVHYADKSD